MATAFNQNSGIHQLPSNCYPPSESDDEDSFVVLNNSLGPDVLTDRVHLNAEPISTKTIQDSLDTIADALAQQSSLQSFNVDEMEEAKKQQQQQFTVDSCAVSYVSSSEISPDEIQKKVDNLIAENLKLKDTLAQNNIAMKKQVDTIVQWQDEVQRVQESHKEKFTDMKKYIAILKAENEQLKSDMVKKAETRSIEEEKKAMELLTKQADNIRQFEMEAALKKVKELEKALDMLSLEKEDLAVKTSVKDKQISEVLEENRKLTNDLNSIKESNESHRNAAVAEVQALKDEIIELRDAANNLTDRIRELEGRNENLKTTLRTRDEELEAANRALFAVEQNLAQTKEQLMASQMHITEIKETTLKRFTEKENEVKTMQEQLKTVQENLDENAALRAQLDLYKNDFDMERRQRKELFEEKNRIADDLQQLQRRNNQLHEEIDQLRSGFVPVKKEEATATAPSDSPPLQRHFCPICSAKFGSVLLLEDHIDYCLANHTNT